MNIVSWKGTDRCVWSLEAFLLGLMLSGACSEKHATERPAPEAEVVRLDFTAGIATEAAPSTRATVDGSVFPPRTDAYLIGMWVCRHEEDPAEFIPAMDGYENLRAALYATGSTTGGDYEQRWQYTFDGLQHDILNVVRRTAIDIYAYYPRQSSEPGAEFDPTAVPFRSGSTDWMWAAPLQFAGEELSGSSVSAPLVFGHAMTCLEIRIRCLYAGTVNLTSMTLTDKKKRLYTSGSMNIVDRTLDLNDADLSETLTVSPGTRLQTTYLKFHLIMPPVADYEDGDFTLSFVFNGKPAETQFAVPNRMTSLTDGSEVTVSEFESGKRYIYSLTLDNTLHFLPVGVDDTWETEEFELEL